MREMRLKPAPDRWVPLPDGRPWPAEGMTVAVDQYVRRRLRDGDLIEIDELPAAPAPAVPAEPDTATAPEPHAEPVRTEPGRKGRKGEK